MAVPKFILLVNDRDRPFVAVGLRKGDRYGLDDALVATDDMVEFYDATYSNQKGFGPHGQFVQRYYVSTLKGTDSYNKSVNRGAVISVAERGLDLHGGVAAWKIDRLCTEMLMRWVELWAR